MSKELVDLQLYGHMIESLHETQITPELYTADVIYDQIIHSFNDRLGVVRFTETYSSLFPDNEAIQTAITILERLFRLAKKEGRFLTATEVEIIAQEIAHALPPSAFKSLH